MIAGPHAPDRQPVVGHIPVVEGVNAGGSYSVAQLMVAGRRRRVDRRATRVAKNLGVAAAGRRAGDRRRRERRDGGAAQPGDRHAARSTSGATRRGLTSRRWATWSPTRCGTSTRASRPRITNSGGLRQDLVLHAAVGGRAARRDHLGRGVRGAAVRQPHGDRDAHRRAADAGAAQRLQRRSATRRSPRAASRRSPGLKVPTTATARPRSIGMSKAPKGQRTLTRSGRPTPSASSPTTSCSPAATATRCSPSGTDVLQPGDALLDVAIDYITAHSPVTGVVEGRVTKTPERMRAGARRSFRAASPPPSLCRHSVVALCGGGLGVAVGDVPQRVAHRVLIAGGKIPKRAEKSVERVSSGGPDRLDPDDPALPIRIDRDQVVRP